MQNSPDVLIGGHTVKTIAIQCSSWWTCVYSFVLLKKKYVTNFILFFKFNSFLFLLALFSIEAVITSTQHTGKDRTALRIWSLSHTHTHACMHARMHTCTHAHTHTLTNKPHPWLPRHRHTDTLTYSLKQPYTKQKDQFLWQQNLLTIIRMTSLYNDRTITQMNK